MAVDRLFLDTSFVLALFNQRDQHVLMSDYELSDALSCDHHFVQAGFCALLLEQEFGS